VPITLQQLRNLIAVIEAGSFRAAAERLNTQQSAISRSILEFEASVGAEIFDRHPAGARLTQLGTQLTPDISAIIEAVDGLSAKVAAISSSEYGQFTLGLDADLPISAIQHLISAIRAGIEVAQITLVQRDTLEIVSAVRGGQIQLGLIRHRDLGSDVLYRRFWIGELLAAIPDDWRVRGDVIAREAVENKQLHLAAGDIAADGIALIRQIFGTSAGITVHDCKPSGLVGLVASGLGVGLMTNAASEATTRGVKILPIEPKIPIIGVTALWSFDTAPARIGKFIERISALSPAAGTQISSPGDI
jgi:DNA-binding transcriptional LysR family regulator